MRAEIQRLKEANNQRSAFLKTLSTLDETEARHMVSRWVMDNNTPSLDSSRELPERQKSEGELKIASGRTASTLSSAHSLSPSESFSVATISEPGLASCTSSNVLPIFSPQSSLGGSCMDGAGTGPCIFSGSASSHDLAPLYVQSPEFPLKQQEYQEIWMTQIDRWSWTGWTNSKIQGILNEFLSREYLPLSLLCKNSLLEDHRRGYGLYCSSALVNAILALAAHTMDGGEPRDQSNDGIGDEVTSAPSLSQAFFDEALCLIYRDGLPHMLPDVQAMGMLAIYKVSWGDMPGALEMAEGFSHAATTLCLRAPHAVYDDQFCRVRAMTYCGAVSLVR